MPAWRYAAAATALAGYALLSHLLMVHAAREPWAVAVLFGPLLLAVAGAGLARRQPLVLAACAALLALLVLVVLRGGVQDMQRLYVLQHAGIHLALALGFGITLRPGATPLISAIAARLHRTFTPEMQAYTRWLTGLWVRYFLAMVALSFAIYALLPWEAWSLFGNLLTPLAALAFFVGEHILRYRRHPEFERVTLRAAFEAYRAADAARRP
ncbi:conserved membrane hypothetical protein [Rubrivivax sp. A210]|uniref:hypothetical protein n=1 Tax=Rubrivivax sp. A210 TaxID=2772301 RepID=UPI00191A99C7|nr:hypothetical protein [Rubrivivax sp. A210]CAD5372045.1 conserved membrane hypothetical protein [Rubrivivax sp. A210]